MEPSKQRLDLIVQQRLGVSPSKAQGLIRTGCVLDSAGEPLTQPGTLCLPEIAFTLKDQPRFVSRGGEKLDAAFVHWPIDVTGKTTLDAGASTGGSTDCLLQRGAALVYAVDVGYGQLDWRLRKDARVVVMERFNIRHLNATHLPTPPTFFTVDCSFISLRMVLPPIAAVLAEGAEGVVLIKPQFEAGREDVGKGGVVREESVREATVAEVREAAQALGFTEIDVIPSPLKGPAGNVEYLAWLRGFDQTRSSL
jgi:23S rRNA (cytidine1920-2'-O)/16S rRNA (cytidine1409-2'-O)-methyltransferase